MKVAQAAFTMFAASAALGQVPLCVGYVLGTFHPVHGRNFKGIAELPSVF